MTDEPDNETIRKVMQELGKRGGQSDSDAKKKASAANLSKARAKRWPKKKAKK